MHSKKNRISFVILILFAASFIQAQSVLQLKPFDGTTETYLMAQIKADTLANHGVLPDRVYELQGGQIYLNTELFNVQKGVTIRLKATGEKPIIYQYPTGTGSNPQNPPGNLFVLQGGNLEMTNIAVSGFFEPVPENLLNVQGGLINTTKEGSSILIDNCLLTNVNGQLVRTGSATKTLKIVNSIFANMGALSTSNFGAGKGIDMREASCDSLILVNNTFVNYQDRVVRHYNFGNPLAGTGNIKYCIIDHNTFVNGMGFHGLLSLGNVGEKVIITNNVFMDAFAAGDDPTDNTRAAEWANTGEIGIYGLNRMTWIFTAPNDTTSWTVKNNFYSISQGGKTFFGEHTAEPITEGSPLSWHINKRLGADSVNAFKKISLTLKNTPDLMLNLMRWYVSPSGGNKTKNTPNATLWNWKTDDMDRKPYSYYLTDFDCSYDTQVEAYYGAVNGYPAGDLNWFPDMKTKWEQGVVIGVEEDNSVPTEFTLNQNYPNPFNPTTQISYNLPKASAVSLTIFNTLGQEIVKLVNNQEQAAGKYNVTWNGRDGSNRVLSSGIYFYQIKTNDFTSTKKMMLLK